MKLYQQNFFGGEDCICFNCRSLVNDEWNYCPKCGADLVFPDSEEQGLIDQSAVLDIQSGK